MRGDTEAALELLPELLGDVDRAAEQAPSLIWLERYDEARRMLSASLEQARARSRTSAIAWTQACLAILELRASRLAVTLAAASESALLADQLGAEDLLVFNQPALAYVAAVQGRGAACREHAAIAERLGAQRQNEHVRAGARIALGLLALGDGLPHETIAQLEPVARLAERGTVGEPSVLPFAPDLIEAYVHVGDVAAARAELETFAARASACRRGWALAAAARCAGLLADEHDIDACFEEALELGERAASPLEQARTRLCLGERLRRANRRREARGHLRAALDCFDDAGAGPWSERARAELRATGETVARRDASAPERLTAQELQIALLVADSKSNRDVAGAMFISRKTVEYHLAHIYRKLDIHSRGELTRLFAENAASSARARD
jgi:DNA-binding CsgD family transcriptional regulator